MKVKFLKILLPFALFFACLFASCKGAPDELSAPKNLRIENGVLYWDEVEYADGYSVYFSGAEHETQDCSFVLTDLKDTEIVPIEVMAFSNTAGINHSEYSLITYTGKYAVPTEGLEFRLIENSENSDECTVTKFACDADGVCVIPAFYHEMRVVSFAPAVEDPAVAQIRSLYLPNTFNGAIFESEVFVLFRNLENIELETGLLRYESKDNCIIDKEENAVAVGCKNSVIPDSVTKISANAFAGKNLQTIVIPRQITVIEGYAFANCTLETVYYGGTAEEWENVTVDPTGNGTFLSKLQFAEISV